MVEHIEKNTDKEMHSKEKDVSVMIQCGYEHSLINGQFLGETNEYFIVKNRKNEVVYIHKNKIIYHIFIED